MSLRKRSENIRYFLDELTFGIVAESGIVGDRYHLGKIILKSLKNAPNFIMQIDGGTGEADTFASVLDRSVRSAISLKNLGLKCGDSIAIMGPNCINLTMPLYAAFYLGISVAPVDMTLGINELVNVFQQCVPKAVFCQSEKAMDIKTVLQSLNIDAHILTFGRSNGFLSFEEFLEKYSEKEDVDLFMPNDFNTTETLSLLMPTSGTTGLPKVAAFSHENTFVGFSDLFSMYTEFPTPFRLGLLLSPIQWLTAHFHYVLSPILRYTRLQTSSPLSHEHIKFLFEKYKPTHVILGPTSMTTLIKDEDHEKIDFSSLDLLLLGGSAVSKTLIEKIKKVNKHTVVQALYGMTECSGISLDGVGMNPETCGRVLDRYHYKLVNIDTDEEILQPNEPGELWVKGKSVFKGYYNNPDTTAEALTRDGWLKTGDILYKDEHSIFHFVDRLKLLLKYKNHHISPMEIETIILKNPGVVHVAVLGIPDVCGDLPVACIEPREGHEVTAQKIKDLVKESLAETKQLRGGVIFMKSIPLTSSGKINRSKLKELILDNNIVRE